MHKRELERRLEKLFDDPVEVVPPNGQAFIPYVAPRPAAEVPPEPAPAAPEPTPPAQPAQPPAPDTPSFLRAIVDQIAEPVFVKDRDHHWVFVNAAFCTLIGQPEDRLIGHTDHDYLPRDQANAAWLLDDWVFETGQPRTTVESTAAPDGQVCKRSTQRRLLTDEAGRAYLLGAIQEVVELQPVEVAPEPIEVVPYSREQPVPKRESNQRIFGKLWRNRLFQFTGLAVIAGLVVTVFIAARSPVPSGKAYAGAPEQSATTLSTSTPLVVVQAPTRTARPSATATSTNTATASPTPTLVPPAVSIAPTIAPRAFVVNTDTIVSPPAAAPLREFGPNVINVVLLGSDRRPGDTAWRTDVVILASIDPDVPSLTLLSFPRDLWVYIPTWKWTRINLADGYGETSGFPGGGPGLVKQTIQYNFGIPVHYYARVDFGGYKQLIDSVGGVDVVADCPLYDIFPIVPDGATDIVNGVALTNVPTGTIDIPIAGVYHLDGQHALWYSRSRKTTSDFDRSRRQQRVLRALWAAAQAQGLVPKLPQLWDSLTQTVETDLSFNDLIYLADVGLRIDAAHMRSRFIDGSMLTWHVTETGANVLLYDYAEVSPYLDATFEPLPKNVAAQAPAWVDVVNGTSHADWDRVAVDRLGWAGFSVSGWSNADSASPHSTLIDYTSTSKGSRVEALTDLFQVAPENVVHQPDPNSAFAYRVVVGEDFNPCQPPIRGRWSAPPPTPTPTAQPAP